MGIKLSINYVTARKQPMFQWFVETLISQYESGVVTDQIVFIDSFVDYEEDRKEKLKKIVNGRFEYLHISPKPSIWIGKHRKTKINFFDVSATRNTGILVAEHDHIVFVDDLSALCDGWINHHRKAAEDKIVLCGSYKKVSKIVVENNKILSFKADLEDARSPAQTGDEKISIRGGWAFGSNISIPVEFLEKINGYDEFFARKGCEDCNFGIRLELAGYADRLFFNKNCQIIEDGPMHWCDENPNDDFYAKRVFKSDYKRHEEVRDSFCKFMDDLEYKNLHVEKNFKTIDTSFNLIKERELYRKSGEFKPVGDCDYFDFDGENLNQI